MGRARQIKMDRANEIRSKEAQEAEAERQKRANEVRDKESKKEIKVLEENRIKVRRVLVQT